MIIKAVQVNIYKGRYLENLIGFLSREYPDIIFMQEVTSGDINLSSDKSNLFEVLKREIGYEGVFYASAKVIDRPNCFEGNAILTRHKILDSQFVPLNKHLIITLSTFDNPDFFPDFPRSIVEAKIVISGFEIFALSCHGAWTAPPHDTKENLKQADIIASHLKSLEGPYVMGADMNMPPNSKVIKKISKYAKNLISNSGIVQTTHPTVHKIAPRGFLIDYIFTSAHFKKLSIKAPEVLVSDHLPVVASLEFKV